MIRPIHPMPMLCAAVCALWHADARADTVALEPATAVAAIGALESGERCARERVLLKGLEQALTDENGALRSAFEKQRAEAAAQSRAAGAAVSSARTAEEALKQCMAAVDAHHALENEQENETKGLRLRLAGMKIILYAVGIAAGAALLLPGI